MRKYATEVLDLISQSSTLMGGTEEEGEEEEDLSNGTGNGKRSREEEQRHSKMQEGLNALPEFDPIRSIDALHPMEVDASGSLSPMQKRHKTFVRNHDRGKDMSLEEIYTFAGRWTVVVDVGVAAADTNAHSSSSSSSVFCAGWMPSTWLDPSHNNSNGDSSNEAKVSSNNAHYQTSGLLPTTTPLGGTFLLYLYFFITARYSD